ncbi:MAG: PAS domain S-box protein [Syntrophobacteraceae bacterium]
MNGRYLGCNKAFEGLWGKSRMEIVGRTFFDFAPEQQAEICHGKDTELLKNPGAQICEFSLDSPGGGKCDVVFHKASFSGFNGSPGGLIGAIVDISGQKRAEAERTRLVTAVEQCAEGVVIADINFVIHYVNPAFERQSGYDRAEILGQRMGILKSDRQDRLFYGDIRETLLKGEVWSGRLSNRKKDGSSYEAEATASPVRDASGNIINFVAIHRDITNEVKLERELRQAQKMEAIGTLAGGIAHDFNNILTAIIGYTEISRYKLPEGSPLCQTLDQVLKAGKRAKDLVKQILTFSRKSEQERGPVSVAPIVEEALELLRSSLPSTIEFRKRIEFKPEEGVILSEPSQIHQVLMNLCANAAHAMRRRGGVLSVNVSGLEIDRFITSPPCGLKQGRYVLIAVSDTGQGMDAAVMERIFDPYFTTKQLGEGTGMGLATVQGIVKSHGGAVSVYSEPGKGTSFKVYLPMVAESVTPGEAEVADSIGFGSERILFVDDEKALTELGKEMLESMGYKVTSRTGSPEALETFCSAPNGFDLVITDMTMPVITGVELSRKCKALRPDIPIILCTGFSDTLIGTEPEELGICEVLLKPYAIVSLTKAIRKALDPKAPAN